MKKIQKKYFLTLLSQVLIIFSCGESSSINDNGYGIKHWPQAVAMADFLLDLQNPNGAIEDAADSNTVNTDSNMEYSLIALAAVYQATGDKKYLTALQKGIQWLAETEEMSDEQWKGSWWYGYDRNGDHVAISPGTGYADARGVDTTSALFVYCLYLEKRVNPESSLYLQYKINALCALEYLQKKMSDTDGLTWSSFIKTNAGSWELYRYKYTADQSDVYLGYKAAAILYDIAEYQQCADIIKAQVESRMFSEFHGRYSLGMEDDGTLDFTVTNFDPVQCQGQCPWVWGSSAANIASSNWLLSKVQSDGSVKVCDGDPLYSLSAAMFGLAKVGLNQDAPANSFKWLTSNEIYNSDTGGLYDAKAPGYHDEYCNNAGLSVVALLGFTAFEDLASRCGRYRQGGVVCQ